MKKRVLISGVDVTDQGTPIDMPCPVDGAVVERFPWWDDLESNGGAVIGDYLKCTKCDWYELR